MLNFFKEDKYIYAWVPAILWAGVIFLFSALPYGNIPSLTVDHFDKMLHFFEYTLLAFLIMRGYFKVTDIKLGHIILFTLIIGGGYGILMELLQWWVPGRDASILDTAANIAGIVFGMFIGKVMIWQK